MPPQKHLAMPGMYSALVRQTTGRRAVLSTVHNRNLLQTSLTELERQFIEKRLTEEQTNLESLAASIPQ